MTLDDAMMFTKPHFKVGHSQFTFNGSALHNATEAAANGNDRFLHVTPVTQLNNMKPASWRYFDGFPVSGDHLTKFGAK